MELLSKNESEMRRLNEDHVSDASAVYKKTANSEPATANAIPVPATRFITPVFVVEMDADGAVVVPTEPLAKLKIAAEPVAVCVELMIV